MLLTIFSNLIRRSRACGRSMEGLTTRSSYLMVKRCVVFPNVTFESFKDRRIMNRRTRCPWSISLEKIRMCAAASSSAKESSRTGCSSSRSPSMCLTRETRRSWRNPGTRYGTERSGSSARRMCAVAESRYRPTIERANAIAPQHSRIFKEVRICAFTFVLGSAYLAGIIDDHSHIPL